MIRLLAIVITILLIPPAPQLRAQWDSATSASISWFQTERGCLYRESAIGEEVFVGCYERANVTITVTLGHVGPLSGDLRPMPGDVFVVVSGSSVVRASLRGRAVYLAVIGG